MDYMTINSTKPSTPTRRHASANGLLAQPPLPSDAILDPVEVRVERQGLSGGRWIWRLVQHGRTLLASSRHYSGPEEAYAVAMRISRERRGSG